MTGEINLLFSIITVVRCVVSSHLQLHDSFADQFKLRVHSLKTLRSLALPLVLQWHMLLHIRHGQKQKNNYCNINAPLWTQQPATVTPLPCSRFGPVGSTKSAWRAIGVKFVLPANLATQTPPVLEANTSRREKLIRN